MAKLIFWPGNAATACPDFALAEDFTLSRGRATAIATTDRISARTTNADNAPTQNLNSPRSQGGGVEVPEPGSYGACASATVVLLHPAVTESMTVRIRCPSESFGP